MHPCTVQYLDYTHSKFCNDKTDTDNKSENGTSLKEINFKLRGEDASSGENSAPPAPSKYSAVVNVVCNDAVLPGHIVLPNALLRQLQLPVLTNVWLQALPNSYSSTPGARKSKSKVLTADGVDLRQIEFALQLVEFDSASNIVRATPSAATVGAEFLAWIRDATDLVNVIFPV